jgi:hypothetical protein
MHPVSQAFITALKKPYRVEHVRGTVGNVSFNDDNIVSLTYSNRCSDSNDVVLGYAYIGQIQATFTNLAITRGSWRGKQITLEYGLELADESIEWIPIGVFEINSAEWTDISINITASDCMAKLDKIFSIGSTTGFVYDLAMVIATGTGLTFDRSEEEIEALPNGSELLGLFPESDIETYRDFGSWLAQVVGGFLTASRTGALTMRSFAESETVISLDQDQRILGSVFSDYQTLYDGISVVNIEDKSTSYYSAGSGAGSVINLGSNPLLQYGTADVKNRQRYTIAGVAHDIAYTPFNISILNCPVFDLGDIIECTGGIAGAASLQCCVMGIDWTFKQTTQLQGFGADPSLSSGKSKTDKELAGLASQTRESDLVTYTYVNAEEYDIGELEEVSVLMIRFATISPRTVDFWAQLQLDTEFVTDPDLIKVKARYYLDGQLIEEEEPVTTWNNEGLHLMHLLKWLDSLAGGSAYSFEVRLVMEKGAAVIKPYGIHASLKSQGLVAVDEWSGFLRIEDTYSLQEEGTSTFPYAESVNVDVHSISVTDEPIVLSDTITLHGDETSTLPYADGIPDIIFTRLTFRIVSADHQYRLTSSDGDYNVVSSGEEEPTENNE